jgi:hypothetical protein
MSKIKITLEDAKAELRDAATGPRSEHWSYAPAVMALLNSHDELLAILGEATVALEEKEQKIEAMKVQAEGANECTKLIFEAKNYWVARARAAEQQLQQPIRQQHAEWSSATFGNVGPVGPLKHLSKEALEAAADPQDLSEWADMQFLLWDAQRRAGITDEQINQAMVEKLAVNKARSWPEPKDGEPRLHIKGE